MKDNHSLWPKNDKSLNINLIWSSQSRDFSIFRSHGEHFLPVHQIRKIGGERLFALLWGGQQIALLSRAKNQHRTKRQDSVNGNLPEMSRKNLAEFRPRIGQQPLDSGDDPVSGGCRSVSGRIPVSFHRIPNPMKWHRNPAGPRNVFLESGRNPMGKILQCGYWRFHRKRLIPLCGISRFRAVPVLKEEDTLVLTRQIAFAPHAIQ